jgi:phage terminase large subunit
VSVLESARAKIARYRRPPNGAIEFVIEQFGATPDPWQADVLRAFCEPSQRRISLQACAGPGKSAILAWCGWYFLATQATPNGHPKALATSITAQNLKTNLWAEFAKWMANSEFLKAAFTWSPSAIVAKDHPATWRLDPKAWPKTGSADEQGATLSGMHSQNVLALIDESGGIPPTVLRAAEQALPNTIFGKVLQAGNPISLEGCLYEAAGRLRDQWLVISITGDPDDPKAWVHSPRVGLEPAAMNRKQIETYGRDSNWVKAYILGRFPDASFNSLIGVDDVQAAMARHLDPDQYSWAQKRLGVDVARFGDDRTVIFPRQGMAAFQPVQLRGMNTVDIAARVAMAQAQWGSELNLVDDTGHWGHGVIDNLHAAGIPSMGIQFHGAAINNRYKNRRAEMWIEMTEAIKKGMALPNIPELVAELITPTFTFSNGTLQLEEKDQIKARLGRSPDLADALALTFAIPDMPGAMQQHTGAFAQAVNQGRAVTEYDPFAQAA